MTEKNTYIAVFDSAMKAEMTALVMQSKKQGAAKVSFVAHENGVAGRIVGFYYSGGAVKLGSIDKVWMRRALHNLKIPEADATDYEVSLKDGKYVLVVIGGSSDTSWVKDIIRETRPRLIRQYTYNASSYEGEE